MCYLNFLINQKLNTKIIITFLSTLKFCNFNLRFTFYVLLSSIWLPIGSSIALTVHNLLMHFYPYFNGYLKTLYSEQS